MLRFLKYLILLAVLLVVAPSVLLLTSGIQAEPLIPVEGELTANDVARAEALVRKYDPRGLGSEGVRSLEVPERDLGLLLGYGLGRIIPAGAEVDLREGSGIIALTGKIPETPFGRFLNIRFELTQVPGAIEIAGLRIGSFQVPAAIARGIGWLIHEALKRDETYRAVLASLNGFRLTGDRLVVVYQWQPGLVDRVRSRALLVDAGDRERLLASWARIAAVTGEPLIPGRISLGELMGAVFEEARERTGTEGDAAAENRAAIIAMMFYVQGVDLARLLDEPTDARYRTKSRSLTLQGRADFAQHFVISAGIAAAGGSRLADAVGLFKEIDDSRGGSGFSFTDLAADRSGVRFAETATGATAARVQGLLADSAEESLFMPEARDLPEFMSEREFVRRFGGVGAPGYRKVAEDIERRIDALPVHRGTG